MRYNDFENKRWQSWEQKVEFRHKVAYKLIDPESLLDVGCGDGLLLSMLQGKVKKMAGIDISDKAIEACTRKGFDVKKINSDDIIPYCSNEFNTITLLDVLEHSLAPSALLSEVCRVAKKNIIVSVPNFNSLPARLQVALGRVPENNRQNKGHLFWFNLKVLNELVELNNLSIVTIEYNTFWDRYYIVGGITRFLTKLAPALFALSFVVKLKKNEKNSI